MALDLEKMKKQLDETLARDPAESLSLWVFKKILEELYAEFEESKLEEKYKKKFKKFIDAIKEPILTPTSKGESN